LYVKWHQHAFGTSINGLYPRGLAPLDWAAHDQLTGTKFDSSVSNNMSTHGR